VKGKTVVSKAAPLPVLLLLVGAFVPLAHADVQVIGVLSTGSHVVYGDSVAIMDMGGGFSNYVTTGWGGDTMVVDTSVFTPPMGAMPMIITMFYRQDDSADKLDIQSPVSDSWYIIPGAPQEAKVLFYVPMPGVDEYWRSGHSCAGLTVSPSIVRAGADLRAERVAGPSCAFVLFDAAGNRVRTLRTQAWAGTATATWNGTNDFGQRLPEGIYYCCLDDRANRMGRKLILTR
jgi:hypothetical protein